MGEMQHYNNFPRENDLSRLPLIAHETTHTFQKQLTGDQLSLFLIAYAADLYGGWWETGEPYRGSMSEIMAYAMGKTVEELLKDPVFRDAVKNGTTGQLPEEYQRIIQLAYNGFLTEGMRPKR